MRNTVFCLSENADIAEIERSIEQMVEKVTSYVPGYQLKQRVQFERIGTPQIPVQIAGMGAFHGLKTSVFLEIEGAGYYLPKYAGNLDIMTSAALRTAERLTERLT